MSVLTINNLLTRIIDAKVKEVISVKKNNTLFIKEKRKRHVLTNVARKK